MGKLVLLLADGTTLDIPLDRERTRIGRRPGTDLCLPYAAVSGEHAVIVASASGMTIEDLGSTNGTLVNGRPIARHRLADGDRIDIGRQQLVYLEDGSASVPPAARRHGPSSWVPHEAPERSSLRTVSETDTVRLVEGGPGAAVGSARLVERSIVPGPDRVSVEPRSSHGIVVVSGPSAGRFLPLARPESLVGRVGVQVAAIRRSGDGYRVFAVDVGMPPRVNGTPVRPEGALLGVGDEIEVAGARLRFSAT